MLIDVETDADHRHFRIHQVVVENLSPIDIALAPSIHSVKMCLKIGPPYLL